MVVLGKLHPITKIFKYDNGLQQKVEEFYRIGVIANSTGAVIVIFWQELSNAVSYI